MYVVVKIIWQKNIRRRLKPLSSYKIPPDTRRAFSVQSFKLETRPRGYTARTIFYRDSADKFYGEKQEPNNVRLMLRNFNWFRNRFGDADSMTDEYTGNDDNYYCAPWVHCSKYIITIFRVRLQSVWSVRRLRNTSV